LQKSECDKIILFWNIFYLYNTPLPTDSITSEKLKVIFYIGKPSSNNLFLTMAKTLLCLINMIR
jgi:hypothetical protein